MAAVNQTVKLIDHVIEHMSLTSQRAIHGGILLTGDPGIGKSTMVEILAALLGIKAIVIEVPHITEEHLINIPFLVVDKGQHPHSGMSREAPQEDIDNPQYKMILAQSNLYTQIVNTTPMNDAAYIQHIKNSSQYIQDLYKHLGGTETEIPEVIAHARSKFHVILFLDEFFRTAPIRIRNVLRDILNNRIGMHEIPATTYILYASNKNDKGLDKMPSNYQFDEINFKPPTKDDWFAWFTSKFHNNEHVRLNEQAIKHFQELLTDEDISFEDIDTKIRTSPRRWEQMLLYISSALPVNSEREAHILLTNIRSNFIHYLQVDEHGTNLISKVLANKVLKAVATLIKDTSNITVKASDKVDEADWREALDHQVKMQMKLGKYKKHVPIVSGPPGIGKAQPLDAKIKVPGGWTTIGSIAVGDKISIPSGGTALVTGVFPQGLKPIYRLTFSDGRTTEACDEHLWKVRKVREDNWRIVPTSEIRRIVEDTNQWVYVPLVEQSVIDDVTLPMDPYVLGCLLGDGGLTGGSITFTTADAEMIDILTPRLREGYYFSQDAVASYNYRISQIDYSFTHSSYKGEFRNMYRKDFADLGLLGSTSLTKFIPLMYKEASVSQKEELLAGLVDTNGYVNKQGALSVSTSSYTLALDIQELVRSIGGIANIAVRTPFYTKDDVRKYCAPNYNITIRYPTPKNLSKLSRKQDRLPVDYQYKNLQLRVIDVTYTEDKEAQCIMVDHPDHLYITDDYIVTHNSSRGWSIAEENNLRFVPVDISAIYADDVTGLPIPGKSDANKTDMSIKFSMPKLYHQIMKGIEAADALYISELKAKYGSSAQEHINKYEHARWKYLILLDELNRVDQKTFNALRKIILEKNFGPSGDNSGKDLLLPKEAIVIGAINPTGEGTSPFTEHFRDAVDFVHAKANWDDTVALLQSKTVKDFKGRVIPTKFNEAAMNLIQIFVNKFKTRDDKVPVNQQPYHLDIGAAVYVSSREYSQLWTRLVQRLSRVIDALPQEATPTQTRHAINEAVSDIFDVVLSFPLTKANVDGQEFFATLKAWIAALPSTAFVGLLSKTAKVNSVVTAMGKYLDGKDLLDMLENQNLKNSHDASTNDQVISDVVEMFTTKVKNPEDIKHYILDKKQKMVEPTQDELKFGTEPASLLENFVLGLVYTLHLHNYENARLTVIGKALSKSFASILSKLKTDEAIDNDTFSDATSAVIDLRQKVLMEINKLNPQQGK